MALRRAAGRFALAGWVTLGRFSPLERIRNLSDQVAGKHPGLPQALGGQVTGQSMEIGRGTGGIPCGNPLCQ